ncbi:MAG: D-alanine--D-alanine ligase, partial [Deltaproteobacteria bacterium]|nr:D-alanine--D-alanine ligase [Deltaproteobacteria bacterium]
GIVAKQVMKSAGIPTPEWVTFEQAMAGEILAAPPLIIKSVWEHASVGLDDDSIVHDLSMLASRMLARRESLGGTCFAERFIDGREFNVALVTRPGSSDPEVLPVAEMRFVGYEDGRPKMVGYKAKWDENAFEYKNTVRAFDLAPEDAPLVERLKEISIRCWHAFALAGYNRVDFRVDAEGNPYVLEVNTNPCISPDSGFTAMFRQAGMTLPQLMSRVIEECLAADR